MSKILDIYTPDQYFKLMRDKLIADGVGLSNFNKGARVRSILEAFAIVASTIGFDYLQGLRNSIPVALYDGFGFKKKGATFSNGYLRFIRKPSITIAYTGTGSSALLTNTSTELSVTVTGYPSDSFTADLTTYNTLEALVDYIDALPNFSASLVQNGSADPSGLYLHTDNEIVGKYDYRNNSGLDLMMGPAEEVPSILAGTMATIDSVSYQSREASTIPEGAAHSGPVLSRCLVSGDAGNCLARAIDTMNGKGVLTTPIHGVEHVINDSAFSGGQDEETEVERARRFLVFVQGLTGSTKFGLQSATLGIEGIKSCTILERYPKAGQNTVVADDGSGSITAELIAEIRKVLDGDPSDFINYPGCRAAGITINIVDPTVIPISVIIEIQRIGTLSDIDEIKTAVQSAIENYINTRQLGQDVVRNEIIALAKKAHPAIYDVILTFPSENVSIDDMYIPRTGSGTGGTITATVTTLTSMP